MARYTSVFLLIALLSLPVSAQADTTGKIAGVVVDEKTGDPLPGVNIVVVGTKLRAVSGTRGEFFMVNVPVGAYDVEAQMIGYLPLRTSGITVHADLTSRIDFRLQTTVLDVTEPLVIVADRPLIRPDLSASSEVLSRDDFLMLPVTSLTDLLLLQNGVVQDAQGRLHIRGGRDDELTYYLDGMEIQDPLLGGIGTHINLDSIEELFINRGGFDAQYGDAMSGIVNIVTRESKARYSGRLRSTMSMQPTYNVRQGSYEGPGIGNGRGLEGMFGGALPRLGEKGTFFLSGSNRTDGNYLPHHENTISMATGNLVLQPHPLLKIKLGGHFAERQEELYDHRDQRGVSYDFNLDGLPERRDRSYEVNLSLNHTLSPRTFYTTRLYRYTTDSKLAPSTLFDLYWTQWPGFSEDDHGRYNGTIYTTNYQRSQQFGGLPFTGGDDFLPIYRRARTTYYGFRMDLNSQVSYRNQLRFGLEAQWYRLNWDEKTFTQEEPAGERYQANPVEGSVYLQHKLELSRLIVNAGARVDYFDTGQRFFVYLPTGRAELRNSSTKLRLSPRLGISHPITRRSLLRMSYGSFYQAPEFRFAYENLQGSLTADFPRVGNPNLEPQKTVAYEAGLEHLLTDHLRASVTATYKDLSNLTSTTQVQYPGGVYSVFTNADYGTVRGLEFALVRSATRLFSGALRYSYSSAEGSASDPQETYNRLATTGPRIEDDADLGTFPLAFDQRHNLTGILTVRTPDTRKSRWMGLPSDGWALSLIGQYGSGLPYTPTNSIGERLNDKPNTGRLPSRFNLDLRLHKRYQVGNSMYTFFTEVQNVFNNQNILNVYSNTGLPDDDGYRQEHLEGAAPDFVRLRRLLSLDPQHYSSPREIRIGFEVGF